MSSDLPFKLRTNLGNCATMQKGRVGAVGKDKEGEESKRCERYGKNE